MNHYATQMMIVKVGGHYWFAKHLKERDLGELKGESVMKILILSNNDGGLYKFRKELIEILIKQHKVFLALPYGIFIEPLKDMGCEYVDIEFSRKGMNPIEDIRLLKRYVLLIKKLKPDIVFTYTIKPNIYGGMACAKLHVAYVVNITGLGTAVEHNGILQIITTNLYKIGLKKAQKIFFQNVENQRFMLEKGIIDKTTNFDLIPGSGVNLTEYQMMEYPTDRVIHFVFVARLIKEKGIEEYFETAKYIRSKYPDTRFHVCGECEGNYKDKLKELEQEGVIIYQGVVSEMKEIYRQIHCTVHPTFYPEGMSNVLLESCACGRPIITTDRSGCREIVEDGVNGFICKKRDSNDLITQVEKFILLSYDEKKKMGVAGRKKVEKEFDRQIVINKYERELYKTKCINKRL